MKQQAMNPYLPSWEYVPDGEPHVFGDRLYLFGSHDRFGGKGFCENDYVCWSAPVDDLSDWTFHGTIYRKEDDPANQHHFLLSLFAPDVVQGPDGRYYLYYEVGGLPRISVAVCDTPAGKYEFYGVVRHADGRLFGLRKGDRFPFDPGVLNDDGQVYLYTGFSLNLSSIGDGFGPLTASGSTCVVLEDDMLTVREVKPLIPGSANSAGTGFEGHEFYEASSMRKFDGKYYFIYSSILSHELCWAVSDYPDRDFQYGGILHSNSDYGLNGVREHKNFYGNNHGSVEKISDNYYVFGHRQTNYDQHSRQGVAEKICFEDGKFYQAEITSQGLNGKPLVGKGTYEARIACNLLWHGGNTMITKVKDDGDTIGFTQEGADRDGPGGQYIHCVKQGDIIGFKYFDLKGLKEISVKVRGTAKGVFLVSQTEQGDPFCEIPIEAAEFYQNFSGMSNVPNGTSALYFRFEGEGALDFLSFELK